MVFPAPPGPHVFTDPPRVGCRSPSGRLVDSGTAKAPRSKRPRGLAVPHPEIWSGRS